MYLGARVSRAINQEQKKHTALNEQNKQKAAGHLEIVHKAPLKSEISKSKKKVCYLYSWKILIGTTITPVMGSEQINIPETN